MATNRDDFLAATDEQQAGGALLTGLNGDDLLLADGTQTWSGTLTPQNGSTVAGTVTATLTDSLLQVQIQATGLEPNQIHAAHIHGLSSDAGTPANSTVPTSVTDQDADGFIELAEGATAIGPALLDLKAGGQFATAGADGSLNLTSSFDLSSLPQGTDVADLFPLDMRTVEIHGLTVAAGQGALTGGEVDGSAGYKATLPVAAAELISADTTAAPPGQGAVLRGDNGDDSLNGGITDDLLLGSRGNDILAGQLGNDQLVGGNGSDTFIVGSGNDVVVDFEANEDKLTFSDGTTGSGIQASSTPEGTLLTAGTNTVLLMGIDTDVTTLNVNDWIA